MQHIPLSIAKYIRSLWMSELILTFFHVNKQGILVEWGGHPRHYGLPTPITGQSASEQISFLEGAIPAEHTQILEFVGVGNEKVAHVHLIPFENGTWILLFDASAEHDRQQQIQQQYNELSVQSYRQTQLLQGLETARQQLEIEKIKLEQSAQTKSRFIASLSHELRAPLTSIVGYTHLLDEAEKAEEQESSYLNSVKQNAGYLLNLIDNVLEQTRSETQQVTIHPINCKIKNTLEDLKSLFFPMAKEKQLDFKLESAAEIPEQLLLDELRLRQVLINLMSNALKFTEHGFVSLSLSWQANRLSFQVEDTGPGISKEGQAKIFDAFHREKSTQHVQGVGLGLAISRQLIELMDGELRLESELGKGSLFSADIYAPAGQNTSQILSSSPTTLLDSADNSRYTILLAEDNLGIRTLLKLYLDEGGYQVLLAENGEQAVQIALQHQPHAILMDLQMPILDGFAATYELRQQGFTAPIIALSASALSQDRQEALQAGCSLYLMKPLDAEYLWLNLHNILNPSAD